jgi:glycine/D-amino acid oxidase-like deaminating enzyme
MRTYLQSRVSYFAEEFLEEKLLIQPDRFAYNEIASKKIIFCNGYKAKDSKFFGWIPLAPVKGEILLVEIEKDFQTIYNKSGFIIPQGKRRYKVGSTYNRHDLTEIITETGKNEICSKLESLSPMNFTIVSQEAGIRPGTVPRRPLIGQHPRFRNMFLLNGLGTKGVSLAPYFAHQLVKCLEEGNNLDQEVDIKKYYSLYFNSQFDKES